MESPRVAAQRIGLSASSLRNYCEDLADLLSENANPGLGIARQLTENDVAIIQKAVLLRKQNLTIDQVIERLQNEDTSALTPYIDLAPSTPVNPVTTPIQPHDTTTALIIATNARLDALIDIQREQPSDANTALIVATNARLDELISMQRDQPDDTTTALIIATNQRLDELVNVQREKPSGITLFTAGLIVGLLVAVLVFLAVVLVGGGG